MDVSIEPNPPSTFPIEQAVCCDICGYPRIGLPGTALCPECGGSPPELIGSRSGKAAMTLGKRRWLRQISFGLLLLCISYVAALQILLVMNMGPRLLAAMNVPAPKIAAPVLIQRSIGNRPGPWGVNGTLAVLGSALAVWLLTDPKNERGDDVSVVSIRGAARWSAVLGTGGALGILLCQRNLSAWSSESVFPFLIVTIYCCELPANTLLYLRLRQIAMSLGEQRAASTLGLCAIGMLLATIGSAGLMLLPDDPLPRSLSALCMVYGAGVMAVGMAASAAVFRLMVASGVGGFADLAGHGRRAVVQTVVGLRELLQSMQLDPIRWSLACGIGLWLILQPFLVSEALMSGLRAGWGGDVPYINAIGPKVSFVPSLAPVEADYYGYNNLYPYYQMRGGFTVLIGQLIAVWLMTRRAATAKLDWRCTLIRWGTILMAGIAVGWMLQIKSGPIPPRIGASIIYFLELPVTLSLYWYLANRADRYDLWQAGRVLRRLGVIVGSSIAFPALFFLLTRYPRWRHEGAVVTISAALYTAASLGIGLVAFSALTRLAFALATGRREDDDGLSSPAHDPVLAYSAPQ